VRGVRHAHGMTLIEVLIAAAILALAGALVLLTPFREYVHGRAASDAATTMAQDIALLDPNSALGPLIVHRSFDDVALSAGPIDATTPLLFASNGSVQYVAAGLWADQHQTIELTLTPASDASRTASVDLNLFTGSISLP
jgi:prepilin-type N-terminal cleavage/methylation domain-containing protein